MKGFFSPTKVRRKFHLYTSTAHRAKGGDVAARFAPLPVTLVRSVTAEAILDELLLKPEVSKADDAAAVELS